MKPTFAALVCLAILPAYYSLVRASLVSGVVGWESLLVIGVAIAIAAALWNREFHLPTRLAAILVGLLSVLLLASDVLLSSHTALIGAVLGAIFLFSGLPRHDGTSLAGFAAVALPASIALHPEIGKWIHQWIIQSTTQLTGDLLHLANLTHVKRGDTIETAYAILQIPIYVQGWGSWATLSSLALLYSAIMGRCWQHTIFNAVSAAIMCAALHSGWISMTSASEAWEWQTIPTDAWPAISALATAIAILSADRFFELFWTPVAADENASRANPLVHAWNVFIKRPKVVSESSKRSESRRGSSRKLSTKQLGQLCVGFSALMLVFGLLSVPSIFAETSRLAGLGRRWEPPAGLLSEVALKTSGQRQWSTGRMVNEEWGTVADVWWLAGSTSSIEITITQSGDSAAVERWSELGWSDVEQSSTEESDGNADTLAATEDAGDGDTAAPEASPADTDETESSASSSAEASDADDDKSDDSRAAAAAANAAEVLKQTSEVLTQLPAEVRAVRLRHDELGYALVLSSMIASDGSIAMPAADDADGEKSDLLEVQLFSQSPTAHNPHVATQTVNLFIELLNDVAESRGGTRQLTALPESQSKMLLPKIPEQPQDPINETPEALVPELPTADPSSEPTGQQPVPAQSGTPQPADAGDANASEGSS